jgi:sulfur carrier protein ThiS
MVTQKQSTTTPLSPETQEGFAPKSKTIDVTVAYGSNYNKFQVQKGQTMGQVLADVAIRAEIGYGSVKDENVMFIANGKQVDADYVVNENDDLEILKRAGEKA